MLAVSFYNATEYNCVVWWVSECCGEWRAAVASQACGRGSSLPGQPLGQQQIQAGPHHIYAKQYCYVNFRLEARPKKIVGNIYVGTEEHYGLILVNNWFYSGLLKYRRMTLQKIFKLIQFFNGVHMTDQ